jgi:ABC-2 type transport system ATP-binding protein
MSILVEQLTKTYNTQHAINSISFEAKKGEVLGFLGPNGAGKTTTMKILTCFIPQTSGTAHVCGFDTRSQAMEVRQRIGYLPEHNPLYKDMYVKEYLTFVAGLHKIPNIPQRVAEMVERTGLGVEQNKIIGTLSKGYRQRVGLAQAMIHNPEVLILDEPTTGLDPNQLVDIRRLIIEIAAEKTVILSTHIMQEVEALCNNVIIVNKGEIVANDSIEQLRSRSKGETIVTVEFVEKTTQKDLNSIAGVNQAKNIGGNRWQLRAAADADIRPAISAFAQSNALTLVEMHREQSSVQDVFQALTQG